MDTISDYCFTSSLLIDLEIPSTIKKIGNYAFSRANFKQFPTENLNRDLEFGKSSFAFTAIEEFTIPSGISYINPGLFSSCQYLTTIRIPQVDYIGSYAFFNCSKLEHVSILYGCKEIQDFAFSKSGIETISFPQSITEIGNNAFSDCINLNISSLPESLTSVQYQTFSNCTNITSIDLRNVASINSLAFHLCINLVEIIIPRYCKTIGSYAFGSCISLCSVVINKGCLTNSFAFNNCTSLSLVVLKETSAIKNYAFSNCSSIRNVVLSQYVGLEEFPFDDSLQNQINLYYTSLTKKYSSDIGKYIKTVTALDEYNDTIFLGITPTKVSNETMLDTIKNLECGVDISIFDDEYVEDSDVITPAVIPVKKKIYFDVHGGFVAYKTFIVNVLSSSIPFLGKAK
ncbi:hypothetical protein TVAG_003000 [Trichomonas vaginalis G3]|uniref:Surface antigen BspA-like n=1 Tax=Trichomonas vaginalis (strain ATCC PRA-98 / G3) TaxID=412133 RepID=A2EZS3_TRIV3|nr:leucine-rich repeats (6 copies)-containing protein [Trichomonas vaginalis G3]EAY01845.1 hypothetical protein TVAG_003000 [Trichomonas vaginalis G3]KAI5497571.1 leucine-rich repeats (6 copies)-containing protein [Trichomonas vaginalis G3]|eukprot:XP_001314392.1 hypothetical protein [Trichomonas vaginalis G3]